MMLMQINSILEKISNLDNSNNEKFIAINSKIKNYYKIINVDGDKSISIRSLIFASMANGKSKSKIYWSQRMFLTQ